MIRNIHLRNTFGMLVFGVTAGGSLPGLSATIVYPGAELKPAIVNENNTWDNSLFAEGSSSGNEVHVQDGGDVIEGGVFGNDPSLTQGGGEVMNNTLTISGGEINRISFGGYSQTGKAIGNTVKISGGKMHQMMNGGGSGTGEVTGNTVTVTGGDIFGIFGGVSNKNVTNNVVRVSGGSIDWNISGGYTDDGIVANNSVTISGGNVKGSVSGGSDRTNGYITGNSVTVSGGYIGEDVRGGISNAGDVTGNSVVISGGIVGRNVYGGSTNSSLSDPRYGDAAGNSVVILGGEIRGAVFGGWSYNGTSTGNSVTISGGNITDGVIGGAGTNACHNTVTLKGSSIQFSEDLVVYGGYVRFVDGDAVTGNTLVLDDFSGSVGSFQNFERVVLNFSSVPVPGADAPILILNGDKNTLKGASLSISIGNCGNLTPGQSFSLIRANDGVDLAANGLTLENSSISGVAMRYELYFSIDANLVNATVVSSSLNPQTKSLSEGRIVPLALAGQAQDLVASLGMDNAVMAAMHQDFSSGPETFFAMAGGRSSYDTGSHVDLSGFSVLAGVSSSMPEARSLVLGAFLETGWGNYSSHNSFEDAPSVRGSGDASYSGGGMLARWDMNGAGLRGVSLEASFRAGSAEENYSSGDLTDGLGRGARYDLSSPYYGGHAGVTFSRNLTQTVMMSSYARFLWNRVGEERAIIGGDEFAFQALTSHRLQGGARFHYHAMAAVRPYAGLGYEWECSGVSRAVTYGQGIAAPSLRGGTGTVEAGAVIRLTERDPMFLDVGVKGYAGKREGVSGSVQLRMAF